MAVGASGSGRFENQVHHVKFVRFGSKGEETPGVLVDEETVVDLSSMMADIGPATMQSLHRFAEDLDSVSGLPRVDVSSVRLGSPIARPNKIIGIGLNYSDHAAEAGAAIPEEPVVFMKATSSLSGPYDDILIPPGFEKVDWEVELAIVVAQTCRFLQDEESAQGCIAGYAVGHDVSDRGYQLERGGQWVKGKSADTFSPLGPWLVTPDEVSNVLNLELRCSVNGELRQSGSTAAMVFAPDHIVWYLSQFMTLEPGDLILTGTPKGVGLSTGNYLRPGDVVELEIPGLGRQRQTLRSV